MSHPAKRGIGGWSECTLPSVRWEYLIFSSIPYKNQLADGSMKFALDITHIRYIMSDRFFLTRLPREIRDLIYHKYLFCRPGLCVRLGGRQAEAEALW